MSSDTLHKLAEQDTPSSVEVPKDWRALIVWAVGRFGLGIVVAGIFWHAWREERTESNLRNQHLMTILENRAAVDTQLSLTLARLQQTIEDVASDARRAHSIH